MPPKQPVVSGIYLITNPLDGRGYVGKAQDIYFRWNSHLRALADSEHANLFLQLAYEKCQIADKELEFSILEEVPCESLDDREHFWMEELGTLSSGYNLARSRHRGRDSGYRRAELEQAGIALGSLWLGIPEASYCQCLDLRAAEWAERNRDSESVAYLVGERLGLAPNLVWRVFLTEGWLGTTYGIWPKTPYDLRRSGLAWHPLWDLPEE
ncbi:MAG TPA: GIY-YIG nuclease family protein [Coriobacteriia bacterium]